MKTKFMRTFIQLVMCVLIPMGFTIHAEAQLAGTGMMGGMQACPYQQNIGDNAQSIQDDINDAKERLNDLNEKKREARSKKSELERAVNRAKGELERRGLQADFAAKVIDHIQEGRACTEYQGYVVPGGKTVSEWTEEEAYNSRMPANDSNWAPSEVNQTSVTAVGNAPNDPGPFSPTEWARFCDPRNKGKVTSYVCAIERAQVPKGAFNIEICKTSVKSFQDNRDKLKSAEAELAAIDAQIESQKTEIAAMRGTLKEEIRAYQKEMKEQMTEGGCIDCMLRGSGSFYSSKPNWGAAAIYGAGALVSILGGMDLQKTATHEWARLGQKYDPQFPAFGYGFPFIMGAANAVMGGGGGFYGAVGGGMGNGAFGCGSGYGGNGYGNMMGGPFGYPSNYFTTPYGGGMYSGFPMGMFAGGNFGIMSGMMSGGMMAGGYPMGMMMGNMMNGGMMMGNMMGMPMGSMMPGGMMMNGGMMAGGYPMGMMMGNMMNGGMPMGNMMGMPMGTMMPGGMMMNGGMMAGGYPMGMMMGNMMNGGMNSGGYPMGMMMNGGMMMGMDSSAMMQMQMQMQQQMMAQQQQQMQMYMQMQQRAAQNYQARQQVVMGLQQELQSLMMRLQQAQMGASYGGYLDVGWYGGTGGSTYNPGQPIPQPYPQYPNNQVPTGTQAPSTR